MARTVTYRSITSSRTSRQRVYKGHDTPEPEADSYSERLVKFVPAEVLAFFVPAAANWADDDTALAVICIVGLIATPLYLWLRARDLDEKRQGHLAWYFTLSTVAFAAWALGTSAASSELLGLSPRTGTLILTLAAFLIPLLDEVFDKASTRHQR